MHAYTSLKQNICIETTIDIVSDYHPKYIFEYIQNIDTSSKHFRETFKISNLTTLGNIGEHDLGFQQVSTDLKSYNKYTSIYIIASGGIFLVFPNLTIKYHRLSETYVIRNKLQMLG